MTSPQFLLRRHCVSVSLSLAFAFGMAGCESGDNAPATGGSEEFVVLDDTTAEEKAALVAARPFVLAMASRKYEDAYAQLSSHAKQKMSEHQFVAPLGDQPTEKERTLDMPTAAQFAEEMKKVEERYGPPQRPSMLYVESSDPRVLSGQGTGEGAEKVFDALEVDMAIGGISDAVPVKIRRAGLRAQIQTKLKPAELRQIAEDYGKTVAEVEKDDDFQPYFHLLMVMVEEEGKLKVGYFEVRPPSILD